MIAKQTCQGRGRPRCFDVERAVGIALALFHERGYDGVGVAELARAIGVSPPSLYAAFGSKFGLFERAMARYLGEKGGFVGDILERSRGPEDAIARLLLDAADRFAADHGRAGCFVMDGARNSTDPEARALASALRETARQTILRWLAARGLRHAEPLADAVMVGLAGLSAAARDGLPKDALRAAAALTAKGLASQLEGPSAAAGGRTS